MLGSAAALGFSERECFCPPHPALRIREHKRANDPQELQSGLDSGLELGVADS